jgi:hypothetical protein
LNYKSYIINIVHYQAGIAQLVERNLAKVEVAGSSPVSRSIFIYKAHFYQKVLSGDVPKWLKGEVCNPALAGRIQSVASKKFFNFIYRRRTQVA